MNKSSKSTKELTIAIVSGDGIGPEIVKEGLKIIKVVLDKNEVTRAKFVEAPAGAEVYRKTGVAFPEESQNICYNADAIFMGATGYPNVKLPDGTVISISWNIKKHFPLYVSLRPVTLFHENLSRLKNKKADEINYLLVRENTEGAYSSRGSGVKVRDEIVINNMVFTRKAIERVMKISFEYARKSKGAPLDGRKRVTCVDKSNVLAGYAFFRKIFDEIGKNFPDIEKDYCFIDAITANLVQRPEFYNVIVAENMQADILTDLGAGIVGGLGLAASANIGGGKAMFESVHGFAPDIAGKNIANPIATILSGSMMLDWLSNEKKEPSFKKASKLIDKAVRKVLAKGSVRTKDMGGSATTIQMGDAIAREIKRL